IIYPYNSNPLLLFPDPIANTKSFHSLLQPFYHFPHYQAYHIIFYQITHQYIPLYHNFPNQFFKLPQQPIIHLTTFTTSPKNPPPFTPTLNKFHHLNINFQIIQPPFTQHFFHQL
ncbi:phosphatidylglycerol lysyltransferase domain-containing protein, partial [Staphylococcus epidermidis]|uniref:phosphatidylglycerol lysyltransferase domain-containing protein n=1 Tax=Staphylococcus epidermidis TaxID=1282 RepID=UPI0011A56154